jgi:DME family drug/metabolite transporter
VLPRYAEIFALLTAVLRGLSSIPTKRGLEHSNPNTSAFTYLIFNTVFLWAMTAVLYPLDQIRIEGFGYFVLAGICAPGLARMFRDTGLKRLGVTVSSPIVSTNTLFSVLMAIFFLGEEITAFIVVGALMIFAGVNLITWRNGNNGDWNKRDVIFPLTAAFFFAISTSFRKMGLNQMEFPIVGAAITVRCRL